jgi:hypothetical protein
MARTGRSRGAVALCLAPSVAAQAASRNHVNDVLVFDPDVAGAQGWTEPKGFTPLLSIGTGRSLTGASHFRRLRYRLHFTPLFTSPVLSDYAEVRLGFKSFLNDFFYVDQEKVERFGIEGAHLSALLRLDDLDRGAYEQSVEPRLWLFSCRLEPQDLRGTGAGRYVDWGRRQRTRPRKQTSHSVAWPKAPALQGQRHWYWPAAPTHRTTIALRKGINDC